MPWIRRMTMKTIGLIGGMSWESSTLYYQIINRTVSERLGGLHSAKCLLFSVDFAEVEAYQAQGNWDRASEMLIDAAQRLERAGCDLLIICTNTMHIVADRVKQNIGIPLLHIAEMTCQALIGQNIATVGLLGTRYTMEKDFYNQKLTEKGVAVLIPDEADRQFVHDIIYEELCLGMVRASSKQRFLQIIGKLVEAGAQGVILGCTEIGLLVQQGDTNTPLFDTTLIHARKTAELAME